MKTKILMVLAGIILFAACKNKGYEVVNNSGSADSAKVDSAMASKPKLVKTAGMRFKVKNVQQTQESISALTTSYQGMVMNEDMGSTPGISHDISISHDSVMRITSFATTADITVKIPTNKLDEFINKVARMGIYVNNRRISITDKSLDYLSAQLKLKSRAELVSEQKRGKVIIKDPTNVLLLKDDMIDQQMSNRGIDDAVKNSVVSLSFYESNSIIKEMIANDDPSAYNLPFFNRLGLALENGWEIFKVGLLGLANLWVLVLIAVAAWWLYRQYKGRKSVDMVKA